MIAMQSQRQIEANILGYRLDRIQHEPTHDLHYEVSAPDNGKVIASFPDRQSAERFIVMRELDHIAMRPRNPAY
jgi:hypothetical protein